MYNSTITSLQIFGIGFSFGIAGPCLLSCAPILITYIAGSRKIWQKSLSDILLFLTGRLMAYILLGGLAGLSAIILKSFTGSTLALFFKPLAGTMSILLGISILTFKPSFDCKCKNSPGDIYSSGGLFTLGFLMGVAPCAPLLMLLSEITLISGSPLEGATYGLAFGLGTFFSGFIVAAAAAGILTWLPAHVLKSKTSDLIFKILCAVLLISLGLVLIFGWRV